MLVRILNTLFHSDFRRVNTSAPFSVMSTICSNCAERALLYHTQKHQRPILHFFPCFPKVWKATRFSHLGRKRPPVVPHVPSTPVTLYDARLDREAMSRAHRARFVVCYPAPAQRSAVQSEGMWTGDGCVPWCRIHGAVWNRCPIPCLHNASAPFTAQDPSSFFEAGNVPRKLLIDRIPIAPHIRLDRAANLSKRAAGPALPDANVERFLCDLEEFSALRVDFGEGNGDG